MTGTSESPCLLAIGEVPERDPALGLAKLAP
jgi:hypothetical protein